MSENKAAPAGLRIGMVARLSGVPTATIRIWERRYQVLTPDRTPAGGRMYTSADVARLSLLRELGARGHSIGTIARLTDEALRRRLTEAVAATPEQRGGCRMAVAGEALVQRLESAIAGFPQIEWLGGFDSIGALELGMTPGSVDVVVVEMPTLRSAQLEPLLNLVRSVRPRLLVVVYAFAAERDLRHLNMSGVLPMRGPVDSVQLLRICLLGLGGQAGRQSVQNDDTAAAGFDWLMTRQAPARRYSDRELANFVTAPNPIRCECPRHLADLLSSLGTFERYSAECENLNLEDAALHAMLRNVTGHARSMLEEALRRVVAIESGSA